MNILGKLTGTKLVAILFVISLLHQFILV